MGPLFNLRFPNIESAALVEKKILSVLVALDVEEMP